jgi:hypothetical protein
VRIQVEAHVGTRGDVSPSRFRLGDRTIEVTEVLDRWHGEDADHFRVRGNDGHTYILKCRRTHDAGDAWEIVSFTHKDSEGTQPGAPDDEKVLH